MKISLSWLRNYLKTNQNAEQLAATLTRSGIEVKNIFEHGATIPKVVAAQIIESVQHPDADRLSVCKVDDGSGMPRQIVCGAKNYKVGDKILLALPGAQLPGGIKIKVGKLRGVESEGMMCSAKELGLGEGVEGLHLLSPDTILGTELNSLFPSDTVLELEVTPNRPDWLGHIGVAREAAAFGAGEFVWSSPETHSLKEDSLVATIEAPEACSFYSLQRISNVVVKSSPTWLQERLEAIGLRTINNIVDVANYVMMEIGHPLHAFDAAKIQGVLTVRFAKEGETLVALDGKTYSLLSSDLIIADDQGPQALAGVIGGLSSSVTTETTSFLLESAVFNTSTIRKTARLHALSTDAAYRFERGSHASTGQQASLRAVELLKEVVTGSVIDEVRGAGKLPQPLLLSLCNDRCRQLLGVNLSNEKIASLLTSLGMTASGEYWQIPGWRLDLTREVDLIEEVARLYGIEAMPSQCRSLPSPSSKGDARYDAAMAFRRRLAAEGFYEARTSTLVAPEIENDKGSLALRNPMGAQQSVLRQRLVPGLLNALEHNIRQGAASLRLFEIGKVFRAVSLPSDQEETVSLGLVMAGSATPMEWRRGEERSLDLYDLKGVIERLVPGKISYRSASKKELAVSLEILCNGKECGYLGFLSPARSRELMVTGQHHSVVIGEVNLDLLQEYVDLSWKQEASLFKFPAVTRDLALILDEKISYELVEQQLLKAGEKYLSKVILFDVFVDPSGEKIPLGKKSIAIALTFQHDSRTLTAEEVSQSLEKMMKQLQESLGIEVRS